VTSKAWIIDRLERGETRDQIWETVKRLPLSDWHSRLSWNYLCQVQRAWQKAKQSA
jgi:hypothetical protein